MEENTTETVEAEATETVQETQPQPEATAQNDEPLQLFTGKGFVILVVAVAVSLLMWWLIKPALDKSDKGITYTITEQQESPSAFDLFK